MRISAAVLTLLIAPVAAIAGDESAGQPPSVPPGVLRPPSPSRPEVAPRAASAAIDEERLAELVDQAVERAMARRQASQSAGPSGGWMPPPSPSPQGVMAAPAA